MTYYNSKIMSKNKDCSLSDLYKQATIECLVAINSSFSHYLLLCLHYNITEIRSPSVYDYACADTYFLDAQAYAIIAKNEQLQIKSSDTLQFELVDSFFDTEQKLAKVNERFDTTLVVRHPSFIEQVTANIKKLIGSGPSMTLKDSYLLGPGSSYSIKGSLVNLFDKLQRHPSVSSGARPLLSFLLHQTDLESVWLDNLTIVNQNFFSSVPKNFKEVRGICVENDGNVPCQKFIGLKLRDKLARTAYNLNTQHTVHTGAVRYASLNADHPESLPLATIDLRKASQMIASNVVKTVFPPIWFDFMDKTRAHNTQIGEFIHKNQLFSSMGNGYTFEMETILFLGILMTLPHNQFLNEGPDGMVKGYISVFGDDIICHNDDVALLLERLEYFGFEVNTSKSYMSPQLPFRESCGADYWDGTNVRPIYLRGNIDENNIDTIYGLANQIRRISRRLFGRCPRNSRFARIYSRVCNWLPEHLRIYGPHEDSIGTNASGNNPINVDRSVLIEVRSKFAKASNRKSGASKFGDLWIEVDEYTYHEKDCIKYLHGFTPKIKRRLMPSLDWDDYNSVLRSNETNVIMAYILNAGDPRGATIRGRVTGSKIIRINLAT